MPELDICFVWPSRSGCTGLSVKTGHCGWLSSPAERSSKGCLGGKQARWLAVIACSLLSPFPRMLQHYPELGADRELFE